MTGSTRSSDGLDARRRRMLFRSWHRGIKEMDLIMGRFADAHIAEFHDAELDDYEQLMELRDQEVLSWIDGTVCGAARRTTRRCSAGCAISTTGSTGDDRWRSLPPNCWRPTGPLTLANVADGAEGLVIADLARAVAARKNAPATSALVICRDGPRMAALARALAFFAPDIEVLQFPAWDCLPYDRVSPHAGIVAQRMTALSRLARIKGRDKPAVLLTTVNAVLQRVPAKDLIGKQALSAAPGNMLGMAGVIRWLELNGFLRASTVREPGDYAVRGGILDLFAPGMDLPVRLDFFGDTLETIRSFDPETQRTVMEMRGLDLVPVAEFQLTTETIRKFRTGYVAAFGAAEPRRHAVRGGERRPPSSRHGALAAAVPRPDGHAVRLRARRAGDPGAARRRGGARAARRRSRTTTRRARKSLGDGQRPALQAAAAGPALSDREANGRRGSRPRRWRG